jgi:hypothetical protein
MESAFLDGRINQNGKRIEANHSQIEGAGSGFMLHREINYTTGIKVK